MIGHVSERQEQMKTTLTLLVTASLVLSACGWRDSRINPTNWFGQSQPVAVEESGNPLVPEQRDSILSRPDAVDASVLIANVTSLKIDQTPSGAIIQAEGVASRQGAYDAELRPVSTELVSEDGVLELEFRVVYPRTETAVGNNRSREVFDAYSLTRQELTGVRVVRVRAAQNALESRRR